MIVGKFMPFGRGSGNAGRLALDQKRPRAYYCRLAGGRQKHALPAGKCRLLTSKLLKVSLLEASRYHGDRSCPIRFHAAVGWRDALGEASRLRWPPSFIPWSGSCGRGLRQVPAPWKWWRPIGWMNSRLRKEPASGPALQFWREALLADPGRWRTAGLQCGLHAPAMHRRVSRGQPRYLLQLP